MRLIAAVVLGVSVHPEREEADSAAGSLPPTRACSVNTA